MNFRTTYVLLGVVVVALGALGIYVLTSGDKSPSPSAEGFLLKPFKSADVKPEQVNSVEIEMPGQTPERMFFVRQGTRWVMTAPTPARVESQAIEDIVKGLLGAKTEKAADLSNSLGPHGLDNPPLKITIKTEKLSETIALGNVTIGGDRAVVYVTTSDRPDKPQAARRSDFNALFKADAPKGASNAGQLAKTITDYRPLKLLGDGVIDPVSQVRSLAVRNGKDELALFREPGKNSWKFRMPADYGEAAIEAGMAGKGPKESGGIDSVTQLLNTIANIQPASRANIIEAPGDLAAYGLDVAKSNPLQIDFVRDDGIKETLFVGGPIKKDDGAEKYYGRHEMDSVIYEIPGEPIKRILTAMANKSTLRDRTVLRITPGLVDAIDIETGGDKFELRRIGTGWQVFAADGKGRPANANAVQELIRRLTTPQLATSFPPPLTPESKRGFEKPSAEVKLWEHGIVPDAKAERNAKPKVTAPPAATLVFGVKDVGDVVFARRISGDSKADFFLPADAFQLASRGRLDYLEAAIKSFESDTALKLSFGHGKDVVELERADDGKPAAQASWKILAPEKLKGRSADPIKVFHLLNQVSFWRPMRVVSDKVTDEVLNRLELNPASPRSKVSVTLKGAGERTFYFGGDVGTEKKSVYMKPSDQDLVFEVDRTPFDQFQKADVQDMTVHKLDKATVKAVKITGWQEVLGAPATLDIERKDGKWTLKAGGMFELDAAKVDAFLNDLTTPKAESFVVYKDGAKPEHNLEVAKNAMVVEMFLDKGDPVKMVISSPNKEGKVLATSSLLPGDVFTLQDRFATIRAKPAAFKKD